MDVKAKASFLGKAYAAGAKAFEEQETAKAEIIELNKKVYRLDASIIDLWNIGRQWSLDYFDSVYARLGTKFERFYFESEVAPLGMKIVLDHIKDGVFVESDGAIVYHGEQDGLHTRVFVSKEKYATYEAKDMALAPLKYAEWPYDLSIIMTGNEQSEYFKVMLAALSKIDSSLSAKTKHIPFAMVNLKTGKMSSRTGDVITAEWLLDEAKKSIYTIVDKTTSDEIAETCAIAAVKYAFLRVGTNQEIAFDLKESISFDGDSGPYLLYTYARCKSVLRKAQNAKLDQLVKLDQFGFNPEERILARRIAQFPEVVADAANRYAPNTLCTYLFHLAQEFNVFYAKHSILGENQRLALTAATAQVLKNGLYLLGIQTVERM